MKLSASRLDVGVPDQVMVRTLAEAKLQDDVDDLTQAAGCNNRSPSRTMDKVLVATLLRCPKSHRCSSLKVENIKLLFPCPANFFLDSNPSTTTLPVRRQNCRLSLHVFFYFLFFSTPVALLKCQARRTRLGGHRLFPTIIDFYWPLPNARQSQNLVISDNFAGLTLRPTM